MDDCITNWADLDIGSYYFMIEEDRRRIAKIISAPRVKQVLTGVTFDSLPSASSMIIQSASVRYLGDPTNYLFPVRADCETYIKFKKISDSDVKLYSVLYG